MRFHIVVVNARDPSEAQRIGRALVEEGLAGAINIIRNVSSIYFWRGAVNTAREAILIVKTRESLVARVMERAKALHGYECPGILSLAVEAGEPAYLGWLEEATGRAPGGEGRPGG